MSSLENAAVPPRAPFVCLHIGDLHLVGADDRNAQDLRAILAEIESLPADAADFVYLPGDIAEDGLAAQYDVLRRALSGWARPLFLIPGDHDRQNGSMQDFDAFFRERLGEGRVRRNHSHTGRDFDHYYYAETLGGVRCLFLDMLGASWGEKEHGLDFRLGAAQLDWFSEEVEAAAAEGLPCAVFMHTYPADLTERGEREAVVGALRAGRVRLVEIGHTHYNEIAHDGRTAYAAARSVGQNEDGSPGYAVAAIDGAAVSWRFKPIDQPLPFVMITSPADRRLATAALEGGETISVRALVLAAREPAFCRVRVDDGFWVPMHREGPRTYSARVPWPADAQRLTVQAADPTWEGHGPFGIDADTIEPVARGWQEPPRPARPGSDACTVGRWLEKGVRGDQLGPNRNGRAW